MVLVETLRAVEICGDAVCTRVIAGKHEKLEASIRRRKILYVYLTRVSGAHKNVWEKALADNEV